MATSANIKRKQGDTYPIQAFIKDTDDAGAEIAYDLTGVTDIKLGVYTKSSVPDDQTAIDLLSTGSVQDAATGEAQFPVTVEQANGLTPRTYQAEIQFIQSGSIITTDTFEFVVEGQIIW